MAGFLMCQGPAHKKILGRGRSASLRPVSNNRVEHMQQSLLAIHGRPNAKALWLGASALILGLAAASAASAQAAPAKSAVEEVVVTSSRAAITGFAAPTPTSVVSTEQIERQGASNIAQLLNQIPAFKASLAPSSNAVKTQQPGASLADLRGLGPQRTLVLVDGMRVVPYAPVNTTGVSISPDMNQIPTLMIQRVEVVTGA
jgi:iron complex outermembrane receptor protein